MTEALVNTSTKKLLDAYISNPSGALLLIAERGSNAQEEISFLVDGLKASKNKTTYIEPEKDAITIDQMRTLKTNLTTKVIVKNEVGRIIVIRQAEKATVQAQNAILKLIEEPPSKTCLIIETSEINKLLDTITSRCKKISSLPISETEAFSYAQKHSFDVEKFKSAYKISNGNPQIYKILLEDKNDQIRDQILRAKSFLSNSVFVRLKDQKQFTKKESLKRLLDSLDRISEAALHSANKSSTLRWKNILEEIQICTNLLENNTTTKLVYLRLCVNL